MKRYYLAFLSLALAVLSAYGRLIPELTYDQLMEMADAIVIIQPIERVPVDDVPPFVDETYRPAARYQGWNCRFRVLSSLKSDEDIGEELTLLYFNYKSGTVAHNGAMFLQITDAPPQVIRVQLHDGKEVMRAGSGDYSNGPMPVYLAFLKRREDGRYEAACDQYDASRAFRELSTPMPLVNKPEQAAHDDAMNLPFGTFDTPAE